MRLLGDRGAEGVGVWGGARSVVCVSEGVRGLAALSAFPDS